MKTFKVALSTAGVVFVEADRHETEGTMICFYRGDSKIAEYASTSVKEITEQTLTQKIGMFARGGEKEESP